MQANFAWFEATISSSNNGHFYHFPNSFSLKQKIASALVYYAEFSEYMQFIKHLLQTHENDRTQACQCL